MPPLTGITQDDSEPQVQFKGNYPNPFHSSTNILFTLNKPQVVTINVFTADGKLVTRLVNGLLAPGNHILTWKPSNIPSGLYILQVQTTTSNTSYKLLYDH